MIVTRISKCIITWLYSIWKKGINDYSNHQGCRKVSNIGWANFQLRLGINKNIGWALVLSAQNIGWALVSTSCLKYWVGTSKYQLPKILGGHMPLCPPCSYGPVLYSPIQDLGRKYCNSSEMKKPISLHKQIETLRTLGWS